MEVQSIYKILFINTIKIIKSKNLFLIFLYIILKASASNIFRKSEEIKEKSLYKNSLRYLGDEYDNFIIIYFKEDWIYSEGFINSYRTEINYLINKENNIKLTGYDELIINKNFGIEIHFNKAIKNFMRFFDIFEDKNMEYLLSVDLSNFDSSLITSAERLFYGCSSLELIDFSNFDTKLITNMEGMFYNCSSLKSIDL